MQLRKNLILILASIGTFVEALDIAIINLTIPSIQSQFNIDTTTVQWLQTLYVLFFGGFLIIGGKLSDQLGRKKVFIIGGIIFMLTSLGAGMSTSFQTLAIFRALQGLGAAFIMPSALSIVTHTFQKDQERNRALGIFSAFAAIGSGSGLSIGGIISTYLSWHWVFLINVPILFITILLSYQFLPSDIKNKNQEPADTISGILLVFGLLLLTYGTHEFIHIQEKPMLILGSITLSIFLLGAFVYRLKTITNPLIDLKLFSHPSLITSNLAFFSLGAFFISFLFLISMMLQKDMNYNAANSGLMLVPFSILSALIAKFILPHLSKKLTSVQIGLLGWLFMLSGALCLIFAINMHHPTVLVLSGAAFISGIGITLCFTSLSVLGIRDVEPKQYGIASSLTSTSYFLGAGIGLSFMTLMTQFFPSEWAVSNLSVSILFIYGAIAVVFLLFFIIKEHKKIQESLYY
jgi:EmrB/QacA subfamily drug resistance transporter